MSGRELRSPGARVALAVLAGAALLAALPVAGGAERSFPDWLAPCTAGDVPADALCGTFEVWEDRDAQAGRRIGLNVVLVPAHEPSDPPRAYAPLSGGPGAGATLGSRGWGNAWQRLTHDILLVDQRGTGRSNPLHCNLSRRDDTAQRWLETPFRRLEQFESCRDLLSEEADLTQYTTSIAADDLDELRAALGYEQLDIAGGSYGTRAALVYMRRHPERVRTAVLNGVAPIAFTNPLYHSSEAQKALDVTFAECAANADCDAAFPDLAAKFDELMARLDADPPAVTVTDPRSGEPVQVRLGREGFAEGLRVFSYYMPRARRVPLLIHRAWEGEYAPIAQAAVDSSSGISNILAVGMLLSVTCDEDVSRIEAEQIEALTAHTFAGDDRVRTQIAVCGIWPDGDVPDGYGEPVDVDVPTLLLSGTHDPVTGPDWGTEAASQLPDSLHLIVPAAHGVSGTCIDGIRQEFLATGSLEGIDTSCTADMTLPPFELE